ncbi:branched-chain amino acid ABC transporter permease [Sorangium sp. So ce1335]|uniref:branched-chain amino acid ABC transporter permease n=1 Tax=Sorangium sp. So ce1335 TaxID=3133335 RepID=UPI003F6006B1
MNVRRHPACWLTLLLVVALGVLPLATRGDTLRETMFTLLTFVTLASSLNLLLGYTGYVNFGHIVFFGLGGYTGFYLLSQRGVSLYLAMLAGGLAASALAAVLGLAILRLRGAYFALATIGINEAARAFVNNASLFGGATGLSINFSVYGEYGGPASALWLTYSLLLLVTVVVVAVSLLVKRSRFGLGLLSIREDEDAALVMGVNAPRLKTLAYVLSAFFPGVVGTLYFFKNGNVEPGDAFRLHTSIETLVMVMLGGAGTALGPILGAAAYDRLRSFLLTTPLFKDLHLAFAGGVLLLIVLFVPSGVVGWLRARLPRARGVLE